MEASFWQEKWVDNNIGFHQDKVNSRLMHWWPTLDVAAGSTVFVPLCGKSLDMLWLHESGYRVLGAELSDIAARDFFLDNSLTFETRAMGEFTRFCGTGTTKGIDILCGDFFEMQPMHCTQVSAFYDRAALIAMSASLRSAYARQLAALLPAKVPGLMLTIDYEQSRMKGPPFAIPDTHARDLLSPWFSVTELETASGPERLGSLAQRGLDTLDEYVYRLDRNAAAAASGN